MEHHEEWSEAWTTRIAEAINSQRQALGLSAQDISDRCTALGYPITRPAVSRIYTGKKKFISVQEVIVLAEALELPPLLLLFPLARAGEPIDYLPGIEKELFIALRRFTGESWGADQQIPATLGINGEQHGDSDLRILRFLVRLELNAVEIQAREVNGWDSDEEKQVDLDRFDRTIRRAIRLRDDLELEGIRPRVPTRLKSAYERVRAEMEADGGGDQ